MTICILLIRKNQKQGCGNSAHRIASSTLDVALLAGNSSDFFENIWIGDGGLPCHYYNSDKILLEHTTISEMIIVAAQLGRKGCKIEMQRTTRR